MKTKLREALLAFLRNSETLIHKDSKIRNQEEKMKKLEGRVKVLKNSKNVLKGKVNDAYAEMEKLSKKAVGMHKNLKDVATLVKDSQKDAITKKSKKLPVDDEQKNYSTVQTIPKPPVSNGSKNDKKKIDAIRLEADLLSSQNKLKNSEKNLTFMNEQLSIYKIRISEKDDEIKCLLAENKRMSKEMADAVKGFKHEMNKRPNAFEENKKMLELEDVNMTLKDKIKKLTEFKEEFDRKNESYIALRSAKVTQDGQVKEQSKEISDLKEEIEKYRKTVKESERRESQFKEYRSNYEVMRNTEKKNQEELTIHQEKIKALKTDVQRKDQLLKDSREKINILTNVIDKSGSNEEELQKLKLKQKNNED